MPSFGPSAHQKGRRRRIKRIRADGQWFGYGKQTEDAVSGWLFPDRLMTEQRGGKVSRFYADGSLDRRKEW